MIQRASMRRFAFVVPTLNELAAQNEDIVQLLIFAAVRLEQELAQNPPRTFSATIISSEADTRGWKHLSMLFSEKVLKAISVVTVKEPATPNLAIAGHKPAYNFFEYLKAHHFDEVHCLDRQGLAYYPTQAKHLGLYFLNTVFAVHMVGGTMFHYEVEDKLLDDLAPLMDDLLERGSLERADAIYVHDSKAWRWYSDKLNLAPYTRVYDLSGTSTSPGAEVVTSSTPNAPQAIIYYGPLSIDGGLPLFCDAVGRALSQLDSPVEVFFVGSPHPVGGMDAVSYIRLRTAKWGVPVTIKREFSLLEEVAFIQGRPGVVICNMVRREGLRQRLIANAGLPVLQVKQLPPGQQPENERTCPPNPGRLAQALIKCLATGTVESVQPKLGVTDLWRAAHPTLAGLDHIRPAPSLQLPAENEQPKVTVCVTHFSRPQKLRLALASLKGQTYRNFEVIVVDDGSPDPEVQQELAKIKQEIAPLGWQLVIQENRYLGAARNYGAGYATGDYLLFMDDDNVAKPQELSTLVAVAQRTGAGIVTTFFDAFETEETLKGDTPPPLRFTPFGSDPALGVLSNCYGDANALYSHPVFDSLGGFTEDYGVTHEDWEFFCRASLEGVQIACVPEPLFWYRVDQNAMFRGERTQLHKSTNLRRHIRPYLEKLPYYQAKLVQLAQGLSTELPVTPVEAPTRAAGPKSLQTGLEGLPYARVAVITRTKDRPLLLRRAIRSVLDQTFKDWLLVIVNDGGDPESVELVVDEVAEELAGRLLVLHHPTSLGMQTASNAAISRCDSDFIIIHDDDDSWKPNFLARTVSHLDMFGWNPKLGGVVTWSQVIVEEIGENGEIKIHNQHIFDDNLYNISLLDLSVENRFPPISFLFRRAALEAVGPFREQHGVLGDWDFHLRLLRHYNIEVIPEPLANYHHRVQSTTGIYGNSVHAQNSLHRSKRVDLHNSVLREELAGANGLSLAQLLALGDLQKGLFEKQDQEFQRLHDYIWTIEQKVNYVSSQVYRSAKASRGRNLIRNGNFRLWPGPGIAVEEPGGKYAYAEICPGFVTCYDGRQVSYRVERRKWVTYGDKLPFGQNYLHLENDGHTKGGTWFFLECTIPSVLLLSGQTISISGWGSLKSTQDWISIGGRYDLGDGRELNWPDQIVSFPADMGRWHCSITCPAVHETELSRGHYTRILLKLPPTQPFEFDLANFQVELGTTPTEFEYNSNFSLWERLRLLRNQIRVWTRKTRGKATTAGTNSVSAESVA